MDFKDYCKQLSQRIGQLKEQIATEEATKNAFIMPFIQMLGYDVFNPLEVVPEMDCDIAKKKGEKIDYAIFKDGEPIMLIECKHWKQDLDLHNTQLQRYFVASKAKFGILTNGIIYRFYTDLIKENIMDDTPFLELNMEDVKESQIEELKKFHKSYFDLDNILSTASQLKYLAGLKNIVKSEFSSPSDELVRLLAKRVYDTTITQKVLEQFTDLVKRALNGYVNDIMSERLNVAIKSTEEVENNTNTSIPEENKTTDISKESKITTTEEELEGFYIVKSILRDCFPAERITYRDAQSYFAIFVDDNNRKPVCRLYFNSQNNKQLGIFDEENNVTKFKLNCLDDIYQYSDALHLTIQKFI